MIVGAQRILRSCCALSSRDGVRHEARDARTPIEVAHAEHIVPRTVAKPGISEAGSGIQKARHDSQLHKLGKSQVSHTYCNNNEGTTAGVTRWRHPTMPPLAVALAADRSEFRVPQELVRGHQLATRCVSAAGMEALQRVQVVAGIGDADTFAAASKRACSFGLFVGLLTGLDRDAAMRAFFEFLDDKRYSANQIRFVEMVVDSLTDNGTTDEGRVYDSPFTSVAPQGPELLYGSCDADECLEIVKHFRNSAAV